MACDTALSRMQVPIMVLNKHLALPLDSIGSLNSLGTKIKLVMLKLTSVMWGHHKPANRLNQLIAETHFLIADNYCSLCGFNLDEVAGGMSIG